VVETGSEIPQTDADMVLSVLNMMWLKINMMVDWSIEILKVMEEADPDDLPFVQIMAERELVML
ncbi:hypothetical protein A2U01_0083021, partial [Trifolium medium]|nr:hypothetical protein [Trifolium medium]